MKNTKRTTHDARHMTHIAILFTLIISCLMLPQAKALAATYYLDAVNGDDANPGTSSQPWKTLAKAKASVSAGDVVNLKAGAYGTASWDDSDTYGTSWDSPITYQSDPAGASYCASITKITADRTGAANPNCYLIFSGIDVNVPPHIPHLWDYSGLQIAYSNQVKVLNCKVHASDPYGGGGDVNGPYNPLLVGISYSSDILIEGCDIYNSGSDGVFIGYSNNVTFRGNSLHDITDSGLRLFDCDSNTLIEYNRIYNGRNTWGALWEPGHQGGSGIASRTNHVIIRGNIIYNEPGSGGFWGSRTLWVYTKPKSLRPPVDWSIDPDGWHDITIENNITYNGGHWTEFSSVNQNWVIRNNTFGEGVVITLAENANGSGLTLYNNIFKGSIQISVYDALNDAPAFPFWGNINEEKNIYSELSSRGCGWKCPAPDGKFSPDSTSIQASGAGYWDVGTFFQSDTGDYPYQLCAGSPAIGFADPANVPTTDLFGKARDEFPDAGCYEYGASTFLYGDVNADGEISAYDAALTAQATVGSITLTAEQTKTADVSGDGQVSAYDAALIAQRAVGLINKFPVEP